MPRRSFRVLIFFAVVAILSTYPLIFNLSTAAPAGEAWSYDGFSMLWNLWWFKHALLDLNANPFVTNSIFAPLGVSLYLHTFTLFSDLVVLPLLPFVSPVAAGNLILIGSQALSGFGVYLLARYQLSAVANQQAAVGGQRSAISDAHTPKLTAQNVISSAPFSVDASAVVAGLVYALAASRFLFLAQGHYNFFMTQWLPFYLLYMLMALRRPTRRAICLSALFLVLALLVELSLGVMLILVTGIYWLIWLTVGPHFNIANVRSTRFYSFLCAFASSWWNSVSPALTIIAIMLTAVVLASPYLLPTIRESFDPRYIPQYWGGALVLSADLVGLFTPSTLSTFLGTHDWPREAFDALQNKSRFVGLNIFSIGYGVLALALLGAVVVRRARVWLWLALALVVLSLGPILHINGQSEFNLDGMNLIVGLPYIVLHYIPLLSGLRAPHRFAVAAMIPLALLVGYATMWVVGKVMVSKGLQLRSPWLLAPVVLLVSFVSLFEQVSLPVPLVDATVPAIYQRIAQEPGDFTIMDVPLGWRSGFGPIGTENTQLQYYQVVHGKRLVSGFAARTPSFVFDYFARQPILNGIARLESEGKLPAGAAYHDKALAAELAYFLDLRYILLHPPAESPTPYDTTRQRVGDYVRELFDIDEFAQEDGITVYRVNQLPARNSLAIDFGSDASNLNRAEGWGDNENIAGATANWVSGLEARVFVPLRTAGPYRLIVRAAPFTYPGHPAQSISVVVNGHLTGIPQPLADGWGEYNFELAPDVILPGVNEFVVSAPAAAAPADVLPGSTDTRKLSLAVDWMKVDLQ